MWPRKTPLRPVKCELSLFQLFLPVARELLNQAILTLENRFPIGLGLTHPDPELHRPADLMVPVRALQHRLGRHTTAQNTEAPHPFSAFDHRHLES